MTRRYLALIAGSAMLTGTALAQTSTDDATRVDELVAGGKAVLLELNGALDPIGSGSTAADELVEDAAMATETSDPLLDPMEEAEAEEMAEVVDDADATSMTVEVTEDSDAVSLDMVELTEAQTEGEIEAEALPELPSEESIEVAAIDTVMEESDVEDADDVQALLHALQRVGQAGHVEAELVERRPETPLAHLPTRARD